MALFRIESLESQRQKQYGSILLVRPFSFTVMTLFFVAVAIGIFLFFLLFGFSRKEQVFGVLVPEQGLIRVYTPQSGIVLEKKVRNGQSVATGDILFVLSGERSSVSKGDTQSAIAGALSLRKSKLQTELEQQRLQMGQQQAGLARRRIDLLAQIEQINAELALQGKRLHMAEVTAKRFEDLKQSNFVSEAQVQDKLGEVIDQQGRMRNLQRSRASLQMDLSNLDAELQSAPLIARREALAMERSIVEVEQNIVQNEALRQIVVRAPIAGMINAINGEVGQLLNPNQVLASIVPNDGELAAELYAPTRAIGFVKPGTPVLIRYQAFPYQKFGQYSGVVSEISDVAVAPSEIALPFAHGTGTDPLYRIRVRLNQTAIKAYGRTERLKSGMQLDASLVLEYRKLYEWVVDPVYAITGRM